MTTSTTSSDRRCREIQARFDAFLRGQLGPRAQGEVQGHLLTCDDCTLAYGELIQREVESGKHELRAAPSVPPLSWYDSFAQGLPQTRVWSWQEIRQGLASADAKARGWARDQMDQMGRVLDQMAASLATPVLTSPVSMRTRGGEPTRASHRSETILALVQSPNLEPSEERIPILVEEAARITADGHFRLRFTCEESAYDGDEVRCLVELPGLPDLLFSGNLRRIPGKSVFELAIDEPNMPCAIELSLNIRLVIIHDASKF